MVIHHLTYFHLTPVSLLRENLLTYHETYNPSSLFREGFARKQFRDHVEGNKDMRQIRRN